MVFSFFRLLARCYRLALPYGRVKLLGVLGLILLNGVLQLIGVTSVFPFFALAANPERIRKSQLGSWLLGYLPPMNSNHLLVVAGVFAIVMLVAASLSSLFSENLRVQYAYGFLHWLRQRLLESYCRQPYGFFLRRNSSELHQKLNDVQNFIQSVLLPVGEVLTRLVLVTLLVVGIFWVQPVVAIVSGVVFGGFYFLVFLWLRPRTRIVGERVQRHNLAFWKNANQFLHGIKTVFVNNKQRYFIDKALEHSAKIAHFQGKVPIYGNGPRYLIEPLAFGGLVGIVVIMALRGRPFSDILPNLTVMAFAGYRLLPALQILYGQLVSVSAYQYTLRQLEDEILEIEMDYGIERETQSVAPIIFEREIKLDNLSFQHAETAKPILRSFNLSIRRNESVGIAGPSGSGKSTLVDLILGLHIPQSGAIWVDNTQLGEGNLNGWRQQIGYVPQDIYLLDDTVEANIAFGIPASEVSQNALREAAMGAQILDFIEKELPQKMQTSVGERGVRLSGGQRQRIGLARALYHRPQILILDEATSALDHETEKAVMETIHQLQGKMTIITIAHRLSTLERCDRIVRLDGAKGECDNAAASSV